MPVPTRVGYSIARHAVSAGAQYIELAIPSGTTTDDTLIVFAEWGGGLPSGLTGGSDWPTGWQQIAYQNHGTRGFAVWHAGRYSSGAVLPVTFMALASAGVEFSLMSIRSAADFMYWSIGHWWDRNGLGNGTMNTTTRALAMLAPADSLVLSLHGEATNSTEVSATGLVGGSGAVKWFESDEQTVAGSQIERVFVASYSVSGSEQYTANVDVSWPNSAQNGAGIQVAIPYNAQVSPAIKGTEARRNNLSGTPVVFDITTIPLRAWMVVSVMSSTTGTSVTAPAGWLSLHPPAITGTRRNFIFAKQREYEDGTGISFSQNTTATTAYSFIWGTGAQDVPYWNVGQPWYRADSLEPSGSRVTNIAPSITTSGVNSLALAISHEATLALDTSYEAISVTSGWEDNVYIEQVVVNEEIETIWVGSKIMPTAGATGNTEIVYSSPVDNNGWAMQIGLPALAVEAPFEGPSVRGFISARNASSTYSFDISAIPTNAWMVVSTLSSSSSLTMTPPAGWETFHINRTIGTRRSSVFGKIRETTDGSSVTFTQSNAVTVAYVLTWGDGSGTVDTWTIGTAWTRAESAEPSGSRVTNTALSIATVHDNSLALTISHEATNAMVSSYEVASITTGWTQKVWHAQVAPNDRIETTWVGTKNMPTLGSTGDVAITYRSPVDNNGFAVQIGIAPPVSGPPLDIPYIVGSTQAVSSASPVSLTIPAPSSMQDGDLLVAVLRAQNTSATGDWGASSAGWMRVGPAWPGADPTRLNAQFIKYIANESSQPEAYTFLLPENGGRVAGVIMLVRSETGSPVLQNWSPSYSGVDPAGSVNRAAVTYAIEAPVLELLWVASEFGSPNSHAIANYPSGFNTVRYVSTSANESISRTVLYTGSRQYAVGTETIQGGIEWVGVPVGSAAGSLAFAVGEMPNQDGSGYVLYDGLGQEVKVYSTVASGVSSPIDITPVRRGFNSVAEMLATPGFTWAHRGGSISWREMSLHAFTQSVVRGYGVLEVSLGRTSDGVWFGLHDQTTDRTSGGTYGNASAQTWAEVQEQSIVVGGSGIPQPYMRWEEVVAAYGSTHVLVVDPKYTWSHQAEFLNMVHTDIGPERAIIKYSGGGSGAAALSTSAQALGFETWGFFYAGDASATLGGNGALQSWGPSWTLIGMEYGASQAIWDEALALGKPVIGHIAPSQAAYDTAIAKGAHGVQVSGVSVVRPVSWWTVPHPTIVGVRTSSRVGAGTLTVDLPTQSGGGYMVLLVGDDAPTQPATPPGWTLINWSTGNPQLNMGIYTAPPGASPPIFTLSQAHNGAFVATAIRFDADAVDITGSGGNNTLTSTSMTATKPGFMIWTLSGSLNDVPPATFTFPVSATEWRRSIVTGGTEGGVALGLACLPIPTAGTINSVTWGLDNQWTVRAGGFFITYP